MSTANRGYFEGRPTRSNVNFKGQPRKGPRVIFPLLNGNNFLVLFSGGRCKSHTKKVNCQPNQVGVPSVPSPTCIFSISNVNSVPPQPNKKVKEKSVVSGLAKLFW